ncbi:MAG TPA: flavodoxin domain-containing protein [Chloroflexota bacterium]|nr:flavodoxin domain-containing protein [Chloroflexota bacterium]
MKVLIVYGTSAGQTSKIAGHIARTLKDREYGVDLVNGRTIPANLDLAPYAAVIVGASVRAGRFQRYILDFVKMHRDQIRAI